jgi:hypothetical protein
MSVKREKKDGRKMKDIVQNRQKKMQQNLYFFVYISYFNILFAIFQLYSAKLQGF